MAEEMPVRIGVTARCTDGECGRVTRVVVDPMKDVVTHLIVEPEHREGLGRLVPIDLVRSTGEGVEINATVATFRSFDWAEETHFLPGIEGEFDTYDPEQALLWPWFGGNSTIPVTIEDVPAGDVAVRRGQKVDASDGGVGEVEGLVLDSGTHRVTHLLLKEGHIFGHKDVAIPITAVKELAEGTVKVSLSKQDISDLPAASLTRHR